jgi:hypothetical protein
VSIPQELPENRGRRPLSKPQSTGWLDSLNEEQRFRAEKALARVNRYIEEGEIEVDDDAEALAKVIIEDGVNAKTGVVLDKDWSVRTALRRMHDPRLDPRIQQRCFEIALELMGHTEAGRSKAGFVAQVAVDAVKKEASQE